MELTPSQLLWAAPDPSVGREQSGRRPVMVVAGDEYLSTVTTLALVVPLTTVGRGWPNHVAVTGPRTGLTQPTWAMSEQVRTISRQRLLRPIGIASDECLDGVRRWICDYLR